MLRKNSSWHAKQSVPHTTVWRFTANAWICAKTSHRTLATKELSVASQRSVLQFTFYREFLIWNNVTVLPNPPYSSDLTPCDLSLFPRLKICHLTIEVIEAECRWCWTPSENTTSMMLLQRAEALGTVHTRGSGLLRACGGSKPKVNAYQHCNTSPGNYG